MDTQRLILFFVFAFSGLFLWEAWQRDHAPAQPAQAAQSQKSAELPGAAPGTTQGTPSASTASSAAAAPPGAGSPAPGGQIVTIKTDLYAAQVDTAGGVITQLALNEHRAASDQNQPYLALRRTAERTLVAQSGLIGEGMPNHRTLYEPLPGPRELAPGANEVQLRLQATGANGDKVVQILTFHRGSYVIDVAYEITNATNAAYSPEMYVQLMRDPKPLTAQSWGAPSSFTGAAIYDEQDKFKKLDFGELDKLAADPTRKLPYTPTADNGWTGMIEHYFVTAWLLPDHVLRRFYTNKVDNGLYIVGERYVDGSIAPGATGTVTARLYAGPQDQDTLAKLAPGLGLVVDYGIFTIIAEPLFLLLRFLHGLIDNWGWSIIVMTIMVKGAFYPLNAASARSMAKMKIVAPKMKALQEQFANDKQQLQIRMMELYKQEKINPLGGCLPILVQIPVFIALYWVLLSAVELRHAPWIGWIHDLSAPDPFFVLPIVYAITAFLQVRLSPTPISDPMQARIMQIMPIAFSVMFLFFPAGLVLYWLVNNILQIGQQWHVNRMLEREAALVAAKRR